jgi:hypothetical protein
LLAGLSSAGAEETQTPAEARDLGFAGGLWRLPLA